jgi:hypothetical protein
VHDGIDTVERGVQGFRLADVAPMDPGAALFEPSHVLVRQREDAHVIVTISERRNEVPAE